MPNGIRAEPYDYEQVRRGTELRLPEDRVPDSSFCPCGSSMPTGG